jgi:aldehyde:ferredoxin oxidoreductase
MEESVWRVDVGSQQMVKEPVPETWLKLGGRGLIARILRDEVPPLCAPLGSANKLIFAPGLLVGSKLSSCDRLSIGGKSPLTGGVKESNSGGTTGLKLVRLGIKAMIIESSPVMDGWWLMHLSNEGVRFESAGELAGLGVYESAQSLVSRFGKKVAVTLIGPGGEKQMTAAGAVNLDKDGEPSRINARGGLGALMGSRRLKAIVIDDTGGEDPEIIDVNLHKEASQRFLKALTSHPQTEIYKTYGTAAMAQMCDSYGALPTRNFSSGQFEGVESISGELMRETILRRDGEGRPTHACMTGCAIRCSNVYPDAEGKKIVKPLEYETIGLLGSNLGIDNLDAIARMNKEINDLGLDTIEIGAALGVAAEGGVFKFGDSEGAMDLLRQIREETPLGRVLGNGAAAAGNALGVKRVPVVKGQALSAYDPRAVKGTGVTYATSPQGADHTCGLTIRNKVDHLSPEGQAALSLAAQINSAGYDTLGACSFSSFGFAAAPGSVGELLRARYGWEIGDDAVQKLGRMTLVLERAFNQAAGFTKKDDRLPDWMLKEKLPPHNTIFDVVSDELDRLFDELESQGD